MRNFIKDILYRWLLKLTGKDTGFPEASGQGTDVDAEPQVRINAQAIRPAPERALLVISSSINVVTHREPADNLRDLLRYGDEAM
ncbi:MAG TPA: hypothetical protein PLI90_12975 [Rhodocyclaceae bacterium]|nr:hypothetical protein [Rhodocyclaceae bacterium]